MRSSVIMLVRLYDGTTIGETCQLARSVCALLSVSQIFDVVASHWHSPFGVEFQTANGFC
jgi:hypothetical protein